MARPEGTGFASHTKTLMKEVFLRNQLEASCQDGERFGEWFETPSYEEGARGCWNPAGLALHKLIQKRIKQHFA